MNHSHIVNHQFTLAMINALIMIILIGLITIIITQHTSNGTAL